MKWFFDTSVLVAAAVLHHPHHSPAIFILEEMVSRKHSGYISAHSLAELYSVLTRTPFKPPLYPADAGRIIEEMVLPYMQLVTLSSKEHREVVMHCASNGWPGGKVHDALNLRCAQKVACDRLYTFNVKEFRALAPPMVIDRIEAP